MPLPAKPRAAPSRTLKTVPVKRAKKGDLLEMMLADIARSGLDPADAAVMRLRPGDPTELEALGLPPKASYVIPYLDASGKETGFRRWRYLESTLDGLAAKTDRKPIRYVQQGDTMPELYLPPQADWKSLQSDTGFRIVITEGEKKSASLCKAGVHCMGLGGVYSFKSNKRKMPLIKGFYDFKWKDRDVVIAYDSDAHTNHMVVAARNELCRELLALGAIPRVADVPAAESGAKQGIDDMLVAEGMQSVVDCLDSAASYAASSALHELSAEVAYIIDPGIVVVMGTGQKMRASDFTSHAYANRHYYEITTSLNPQGKMVERMTKKKAAQAWLEWEHRFELGKMVYEPGQDPVTREGDYNTWPGWGVQPKKGSIAPWKALMERLFGSDTASRAWFERWLALPLQRPGSKMFTSCLLWGVDEGTGKSIVGKTMGRIYGKNYALLTDKELDDSRNEWAQQKQFVLGDDVTGHENRKHAERLKVIITQEMIRIDPKYIQSFTLRDVLNYLFTSNRPDAFFLDDNNRRNFVWEVTCPPMTKAETADYVTWLDGDGPAALFHHLLALDLGDMEASDRAPWTSARDAMIDDGQSSLGRWVKDLKDGPEFVLRIGEAKLQGDLWSSQDLLKVYDPEEKHRVTASAVSRELKRAGFRQAYGGNPVPTAAGQRRLFMVRNVEQWHRAAGPKLAEHYAATVLPTKKRKV